jgi:hypothetical protein
MFDYERQKSLVFGAQFEGAYLRLLITQEPGSGVE